MLLNDLWGKSDHFSSLLEIKGTFWKAWVVSFGICEINEASNSARTMLNQHRPISAAGARRRPPSWPRRPAPMARGLPRRSAPAGRPGPARQGVHRLRLDLLARLARHGRRPAAARRARALARVRGGAGDGARARHRHPARLVQVNERPRPRSITMPHII
jgi:hypothetical protein